MIKYKVKVPFEDGSLWVSDPLCGEPKLYDTLEEATQVALSFNGTGDVHEYMSTDNLSVMSEIYTEARDEYARQADEFWNSLNEEQRLQAFYSVASRIHQGELVDKQSYRGVLYSTFGFGTEAYTVGMDAGYMEIHNRLLSDD